MALRGDSKYGTSGIPVFLGDGASLVPSVSSYSLTGDIRATRIDWTGSAVLDTNCFRIFAQNHIILSGTSSIRCDGKLAAAGSSTFGGTGGVARANGPLGTGSGGGRGGNATGTPGPGAAGLQPTLGTSFGGAGGLGGQDGTGTNSGGAGGAGFVSPSAGLGAIANAYTASTGWIAGWNTSATAYYNGPMHGGAGGGGGGAINGCSGGGGGGGAGVLFLCAPYIEVGVGCVLSCIGGAGGAGAPGSSVGGAGGGAGGGGGLIILVCNKLVNNGVISVAGGAGGAGGAYTGSPGGGPGDVGQTGAVGQIWILPL